MKALLYLLPLMLLAALSSSCTTTTPYDETAFRLEDGPESSRYGYRGQGVSEDGERRIARRSILRDGGLRDKKPDDNSPAGPPIVRPEGTDGGGDPDQGVVGTEGGTDDPETTGGSPDPDPDPTAGGDDPPTGGGAKPMAKIVPGKYGHVYSPFAEGKEVDVSGFPPGTEVRCPYTDQIFRVP